jgi:hypothetical protein
MRAPLSLSLRAVYICIPYLTLPVVLSAQASRTSREEPEVKKNGSTDHDVAVCGRADAAFLAIAFSTCSMLHDDFDLIG